MLSWGVPHLLQIPMAVSIPNVVQLSSSIASPWIPWYTDPIVINNQGATCSPIWAENGGPRGLERKFLGMGRENMQRTTERLSFRDPLWLEWKLWRDSSNASWNVLKHLEIFQRKPRKPGLLLEDSNLPAMVSRIYRTLSPFANTEIFFCHLVLHKSYSVLFESMVCISYVMSIHSFKYGMLFRHYYDDITIIHQTNNAGYFVRGFCNRNTIQRHFFWHQQPWLKRLFILMVSYPQFVRQVGF